MLYFLYFDDLGLRGSTRGRTSPTHCRFGPWKERGSRKPSWPQPLHVDAAATSDTLGSKVGL